MPSLHRACCATAGGAEEESDPSSLTLEHEASRARLQEVAGTQQQRRKDLGDYILSLKVCVSPGIFWGGSVCTTQFVSIAS